jgi:nicotinamide-nucleotide adenylyltransferase
VTEPKLLNRSDLSGTEIRRRMVKNLKWTHLVPEQTQSLIEEVGGVERLKKISDISIHKN